MVPSLLLGIAIPFAVGQRTGTMVKEANPNLLWSNCTAANSCQTVNSSLVLDANLRWIHEADGWRNCFTDAVWDPKLCPNDVSCTANCVMEGVDNYSTAYGIRTKNDSVSLQLVTRIEFSKNVGSRVFLLDETKTKYQTFVLQGNEFAFDVDLATVECGINSAMYFLSMDADGGVERFKPLNQAGAGYGTGYCDAQCPMDGKFIGGKTNSEGWAPSATDPVSGRGMRGSCCPEFAIWDSNAHAYSMSSHLCPVNDFRICEDRYGCSSLNDRYDDRYKKQCDPYGCNYNPFRMGATSFYGKGKAVDTSKKFTVITRFTDARVYQIFVQDGKRIDAPVPEWSGLPKEAGLSAEICAATPVAFHERDRFVEGGGWTAHKEVLSRPMVLAMSIFTDHYSHNLWLDGYYPPFDGQEQGAPGLARGECPLEDSEPSTVENLNPNAKVTWSNIRFGPIGSTVAL